MDVTTTKNTTNSEKQINRIILGEKDDDKEGDKGIEDNNCDCCAHPSCYTQCDVPKYGFRRGWSGPSYWPFSKGNPYKSVF